MTEMVQSVGKCSANKQASKSKAGVENVQIGKEVKSVCHATEHACRMQYLDGIG